MKRAIMFLFIILNLVFLTACTENPGPTYTYIGKIIDIELGPLNKLILELDTVGKVIYKYNRDCLGEIRINQSVYDSSEDNYLWVKYGENKYC